MKIKVEVGGFSFPPFATRIGNVYPIKGGRGLRDGHMQVLIAITEPRETWQGAMGLFLVIDKAGNPVGVNSYGMHVVDGNSPIAFVDGLEEIVLTMRSL